MTLLHSYPVGQTVELSDLGRHVWRLRHPLRTPNPTGIVSGYGRKPNTIRVRVTFHTHPETYPARYWRPILNP